MDFRAAELWSHAPSIVEKLDVAIKQLGNLRATSRGTGREPEGCGERVLGIKTFRVDVFGLMLLRLKISTCVFLVSMRTMWTEADEFHVSWQFCPV